MTGHGFGHGFGLRVGGSSFSPLDLAPLYWLKPESIPNPNLLAVTDDLESANWTENGTMTTTGGQTDPLGGSTAFALTGTVTSNYLFQNAAAFQAGKQKSAQLWMKRGPGHNGTAFCRLFINDGIANRTIYNAVPPAEWTLISANQALDASATQAQYRIYPDSSTGSQTLLVWHPQLELGSTVTPYQENTGSAAGVVTSWVDSSGNGNNFSGGSDVNDPIVQAEILDGYSAMSNDGVDDELTRNALNISQPFSVFYVLVENGTEAGFWGPTNGMWLQTATAAYITGGTTLSYPTRISGNLPRMFFGSFDGDESSVEGFNWDGSGSSVSNSGPAGAGGITANRVSWVSTPGPDMYTVEVLVYDDRLSTVERNKVKNYFDIKYPSLGIGQSNPVFSPAELDDMILWLDPNDLSAYDDDDPITSWLDSSGNGNHASQAGGPKALTNALDGYTAADFLAADTAALAITNDPSLTGQFEVWMVVECTSIASGWLTGSLRHLSDDWWLNGNQLTGPDQSPTSAPLLFRFWRDASNNLFAERSGVDVTATDTDALAVSLTRIGKDLGSNYYTGQLVEFMAFDSRLNDADATDMYAYFAAKFPSLP